MNEVQSSSYEITKESNMYPRLAAGISMMLLLSACGGGGNGDDAPSSPPPAPAPQTATGVFKDSNVGGLNYTSGGQTGVTGTDGSFTYEVGQPVTFKVGAVSLGSTAGKALVTPIDLVSGGTDASVEVQNRVRLLMMLDADGDPSNGIIIPESVRTRAASWVQVDFSTADLPAALANIIADARSASGGTHVLPTADAARAHLRASFLCAYSGGFRGTYTGAARGSFGFLALPNGAIFGLGYDDDDEEIFTTGAQSTPASVGQTVAFVAGTTSSGASFSGQFTSTTAVSGSWRNGADTGTFSGSRLGGLSNALYRFGGIYSEAGGDDAGLFTFDVDTSDQVSGVAYSVVDDEFANLTGSVSGTALTGTTSTGISFSATLNKTSGALTNGSYTGTNGSGSFSGAGCRLN